MTDDARGELLACPFCGEPPYARAIGGPRGLHIIGCKNDGCEINPKASGETSHEVAETWNTRAAPVPSCDAEPVAWQCRNIGKDGQPWSSWYLIDGNPNPDKAQHEDEVFKYEFRPLYATPPSRSDVEIMLEDIVEAAAALDFPPSEAGTMLPEPVTPEQSITLRNAALDFQERRAKKNRWRFLCLAMPHEWSFTHLFDEAANYDLPYGMHRGSSHYAGICLRCGKRDLFSGQLRASTHSSTDRETL